MRAIKTTIALLIGFAMPGLAVAVPALQLDCDPCTYVDGEEQSNISTNTVFEVAAIATPGGSDADGGQLSAADIEGQTFFLSIALVGVDFGSDFSSLGTLLVNGAAVDLNTLVWGTPPAEATANPLLGKHGIFDAYFLEIEFTFPTAGNCGTYNTQTDADYVPAGSDSYCETFDIDMSGLAMGIELHFDLYNEAMRNGDTIRGIFAPFSHDAGTQVPEPGTLGLLGAGLIALGLSRRRRRLPV